MNFKRTILKLVLVFSTAVLSTHVGATTAETFAQYLQACKTYVGFTSIPRFSCKQINFRRKFATPYLGLDFSRSDDWVGHKRVNDDVDAVFACRWVESDPVIADLFNTGGSGEMIVHNRRTGATCFFDGRSTGAAQFYPTVDINPVSPTDSNATAAARAWAIPDPKDRNCASCHAAGAYIASPQIVYALETFGLINDGHDINGGHNRVNPIYHAVGSTNSAFAAKQNQFIQNSSLSSCASACHALGGSPVVDSLVGAGAATVEVLIPSINHVIDDMARQRNVMPPNDPYSNYRWANIDTPNGTGDYESIANIIASYPSLNCGTPKHIEAHVVDDSNSRFSDTDLPDVLQKFNLNDGLVCINSDQPGGRCNDYETSYQCVRTDGSTYWTAFNSRDTPGASGDYERRSDYPFPADCSSVKAMEARASANDGILHYGVAPVDRLARFDTRYGLKCVNSDQPGGTCSNYTVRFTCN